MRKAVSALLIIIFGIAGFSAMVSAEDGWHFQADLEVPEPGMVECVLPAGLFFSAGTAGLSPRLDLSLIGPDGNARSFELYWKEENRPRKVSLESSRVYLEKTKEIIWEAPSPKNFRVESIRIDFGSPERFGKVNVEARDLKGWHMLAENVALYRAGDTLRAEVRIEPAVYEQFRLSFSGYDERFREIPFLVKAVTVFGRSVAKDYVESLVSLKFTYNDQGSEPEIRAFLPGSGLWVKTLALTTEARFQGTWRLGREVIVAGKRHFKELLRGNVTTVSSDEPGLTIPVNRPWPGRSFVLKLDPKGRYLGSIEALQITARLPRLVFWADKAGTYLARSGSGSKMQVKKTPGDPDRQIDWTLLFSEVLENRMWRPEGLVKKFSIQGGPFNEQGYLWKANLNISDPGYYRLVLNREASLLPNPDGIRLVRDNIQIPYFRGQGEAKEIEIHVQADYDEEKNKTVWTLNLPAASDKWDAINLESRGIFERQAVFLIPKSGKMRWKEWKVRRWQNRTKGKSVLSVGLDGFAEDVTELRVTMDHGDNRPIELTGVTAVYHAQALLFLVQKPGEYTLIGGNQEAPGAKYDLTLVQAHLMGSVPKPASMGEIKALGSAGWKPELNKVFSDRGWGLYAVLGLVTLVLIVLIIKLFPREV